MEKNLLKNGSCYRTLRWICLFLLWTHLSFSVSHALDDEEIARLQSSLSDKTVGERISLWAEKFLGTPYDPDPMGEYVTKETVVADERVDCMYLAFRAVELSLSRSPGEAIEIALGKRFHSKGILREGKVVNYEDRFEYGEDMILSGKWGREITPTLGKMVKIKGSRGKAFMDYLPSNALLKGRKKLRSGDILFFIKKLKARQVGEIVGHLGIVKVEKDVFLIHASGKKRKGGEVKKVLLKDYILKMPFIGVKVTRFDG
jgi:hypothetical protein